ncbi:hypothetical protein QE152_g29064 [Popillia japonica]|uniref:Nucleic-acid-binding protein from transposon X-element n=1 Tax=Popillia japonica TaxID=7064 RepID=A0AAW1JIY1_POPJA
MSNVKNITRGRSKLSSELADSSSNDSLDSIATLAGKAAKFLAEEDAKGRFDAASNPVQPIVGAMDGSSQEAVRQKSGLTDFFNVAVANRYGILADSHAAGGSSPMDVAEDAAAAPSVEDNTSQPPRKAQKPPPVCFIGRVNEHYREFRAKLDAISRDYFQQFAGEKTLIYYRKLEDYKRFIKMYSGTLPFYTYTPRSERTFAYLIKGLHHDIEVREVKDELIELEIPVINVEKFKNTKNAIFMITVPKNIPMNELYNKAKYLQRTRVYYEPHISKRELIQCKKCQCKKCQAWGHATTNCHLNVVRCVKCADKHRSFECAKSREEPAVCCNCGKNHPASSVECPAYIAAVEAKNKRNMQATLTQVNKKRFLPAPPPKTNAWMRNEFPPLSQTVAVVGDGPIRNSEQPGNQRTSPDSEERGKSQSRQRRQDTPSQNQNGGPTWLRVGENKRVNGEYEATETRGGPSSSATNDADFTNINRIASSFNAINEIVNLEWLADRVEELHSKIKKCSTLLEYARVISEFNSQQIH